MSDELRLPDRLAACEAELAAQPLAVSTINRDELMYRAGWAAAEAALSGHAANSLPTSSRGVSKVIAWSAASAALAASLAVAVTLALSSGGDRSIAVPSGPERPTIMTTVAMTPTDIPAPRRLVVIDPLLERLDALANGTSAARGGIDEASVWAATRRLRAGRPDQPILASAAASATGSDAIDSRPARELLDQMLPRRARPSSESGEASGILDFLRPLTAGGDTI